jgi:hypothetical protein
MGALAGPASVGVEDQPPLEHWFQHVADGSYFATSSMIFASKLLRT